MGGHVHDGRQRGDPKGKTCWFSTHNPRIWIQVGPYDGSVTMPEARLLRYFLTVAEEGSFTRAAARLHIAQPALSTQIRRLESRLGVSLLHRTTRVVRLTEAGRAVYERGPDALAALEAVWEAARRAGQGELGRLRLAYSTSTGYGTVPALVEAVGSRLPGLQVTAESLRTPDIAEAVLTGRADAGIARTPEAVPGIRLLALRTERRGILLSSDHPLAGRYELTPADVAAFPLLLHERAANPAHHDEVLALFRSEGLNPRLATRPIAFDPTQSALRDARTLGLVGESSGRELPGWLRWIPLPPGTRPLTTHLVLPDSPSPVVARFTDIALAAAHEAGWLPG